VIETRDAVGSAAPVTGATCASTASIEAAARKEDPSRSGRAVGFPLPAAAGVSGLGTSRERLDMGDDRGAALGFEVEREGRRQLCNGGPSNELVVVVASARLMRFQSMHQAMHRGDLPQLLGLGGADHALGALVGRPQRR
jgi:hypothetical protein